VNSLPPPGVEEVELAIPLSLCGFSLCRDGGGDGFGWVVGVLGRSYQREVVSDR
jgi:hypothetical protein